MKQLAFILALSWLCLAPSATAQKNKRPQTLAHDTVPSPPSVWEKKWRALNLRCDAQKIYRWTTTQKCLSLVQSFPLPLDSILNVHLIKESLNLYALDSVKLQKILRSLYFEGIPLVAQKIEKQEAPRPWKRGGYLGVDGTQMALKDWSEGGENTYTLIFEGKGFINYLSPMMVFENDFMIRYGIKQNGVTQWYKSDDKIELNSHVGFRASSKWSYSAALNFKTQIAKGYIGDQYSSNLFSPAYLTMSLGMEYGSKDRLFKLALSPLSYELTYLMDASLAGRFGISEGRHHRATFGALVNTEYKVTIMENVDIETHLRIFADYLSMNIECFKVNFDVKAVFKINRFLSAQLKCEFLWDPRYKFDTTDEYGFTYRSRRLQIREQLRLGFIYRFGDNLK